MQRDFIYMELLVWLFSASSEIFDPPCNLPNHFVTRQNNAAEIRKPVISSKARNPLIVLDNYF
jgi:hypothetical protein